ncbi:MAG: hypothetical protein ACR2FQ_07485 [Pseudonocardiaceae bacterium]
MSERDYRPFEHLTTPRAELYRQIMGVFVHATRRWNSGTAERCSPGLPLPATPPT